MNPSCEESNFSTPEGTQNSPIYNKGRKFKIFTVISAVIISLVCSVCFRYFFDVKAAYFTDTPFIYVFVGLIAAICLGGLIFVLSSSERIAPTTSAASTYLSYLAGLGLLFLLMILFADKNWLIALLLVAAVVYFIGICKKNTVAHTAFAILAVAFCISLIAKTYFENDIPINSPFKLLCQFGVGFLMLLVLSEIKLYLDGGKVRTYMLISCLSFCINLCAVSASISLTFSGMENISVYFIPACAAAVYSAKMLISHTSPENTDGEDITDTDSSPLEKAEETTDTSTTDLNEKGHNTDENIG